MAILVRADLLILPFVLAAVVAATLRRAGARRALTAAGAYLVCAALVLAPWSVYASRSRHQFTPITSSSWSSLFVGTYLPGGGRIVGLREALGDEARAHNPHIRHIENRNLRTEWILDAVAARHPGLGRSAALQRETLHNLRVYGLGRPLAFAAMEAHKLDRMWIGYDRGTFHNRRTWILVVHVLLSSAGLAGLALRNLADAPAGALGDPRHGAHRDRGQRVLRLRGPPQRAPRPAARRRRGGRHRARTQSSRTSGTKRTSSS